MRFQISLVLLALAGCSDESPHRSSVDTVGLVEAGPASDGSADQARGDAAGGLDLIVMDSAPDGPTKLPSVNGPCPTFSEGDLTFNPKGTTARKARVWIGPEAQTKSGPLVFYFHGTGMSPSDATWSIGSKNIQEIKTMGGMVVAPYSSGVQYEWYIANGDDREDDALVVDEIVACAVQQVGIDARRIHATGMSAGGMITCDLALRRASYLASTAPMSGGFSPWNPVPTNADPSNKSAAMVIHGGTSDTWGSSLKYKELSEKFRDEIVQNGGFAFICDHGQGHTVPMDAIDSVWRFFKDHPWNTVPSPYAGGLPAGFPSYCAVP